MKRARMSFLTPAIALLTLSSTAAAQHEHGGVEKLGKVEFSISCAESVRAEFNRGVALLHSFGYTKAEQAFSSVAEKDPACGMAYWGLAMTHNHPLWEKPRAEDLKAGWAAVEKAKAAGAETQRERDYIAAVESFYKDSGKVDHRTRALAYERAMEALHTCYPEDREATIFYALAVRADAPDSDKTYANQKKAGAILEKMFAVQPEHPGLAHYIIHCYDYPGLAEGALDAARRYSKIAPDSPHALHMPSHIFTRLGLWQDSIESNLASAAAARKQNAAGDELHARDYLVYAYLQKGEDRAAVKQIEALPQNRQNDPAYFAGLYGVAAMPARYAVERHRWAEAAALKFPENTFTGRDSWKGANLYFARALGAARSGNLEAAGKDLRELSTLREALTQANEKYWAEQLQIQEEIVGAWVTLARGEREEALRRMRAAADHEDSTDKDAVTPGVILPARELLGDMLMELQRPGEALVAYESTFRAAPGRFNALSGAARAAAQSGDSAKAKTYSAKLVAMCEHADGDRPELREARTLLAAK